MASDSDAADLSFDVVIEVIEKLGSQILLDVKVGSQHDGGRGRADRPSQSS